MELNLYDIVEYNGNKHRIMDIDSYDEDLDLAGVGIWVDPDSVTLVESFTAPTLSFLFRQRNKKIIRADGIPHLMTSLVKGTFVKLWMLIPMPVFARSTVKSVIFGWRLIIWKNYQNMTWSRKVLLWILKYSI